MGWTRKFGLDGEGGPFQSLLCTARGGVIDARTRKRLARKMGDELTDSCDWSDDAHSDEDENTEKDERSEEDTGIHSGSEIDADDGMVAPNIESKQEHVINTFRDMIVCEREAWGRECFVFYRVVSKKYVLYQFNTLMLRCFNEVSRQVHYRDRLFCTPSLEDSIYPGSMEELRGKFMSREFVGDSGDVTSDILISVNNCLIPSNRNSIQLHSHLSHEEEAGPMNYYTGYDETTTYERQMQRFMVTFFELSEEDSRSWVKGIFKLYRKAQKGAGKFKGHCLQICIPSAALSKFAYPCVSYGWPVELRKDSDDRLHVYDIRDTTLNRQSEGVSLAQLLRRNEMRELQSRIIAHPNLFLAAGAYVNVFHANPHFNPCYFKRDLFTLLQPLIFDAMRKRKRITLRKFL